MTERRLPPPRAPVLGRWASLAVLLLVVGTAVGAISDWRRATAEAVTVEIAGERLRIPVGYIPNPRRRVDGRAEGINLELLLPDFTPPGPFQPGQDSLLVSLGRAHDDAETMLSRLQVNGVLNAQAIERERNGVQSVPVAAGRPQAFADYVMVKQGRVTLLINCDIGASNPRCGASGSHWRSLSVDFSFQVKHLDEVTKIQDRLRRFLDSLVRPRG